MSTAQGDRRLGLRQSRQLLYKIPLDELFELPGRPHVVYQLRSYAHAANPEDATTRARNDVPFLFKAFETGQIGPKKMAKMHGGKARVATIHEYLDWTVTAQSAEADDELDFGGFRVLVILPRYTPQWPPPEYLGCRQGNPPSLQGLGAPREPLPLLQTHAKPVCAATIRSGPGYLEIPFVATKEGKRGMGYCRCIVEAIEAISHCLGLRKLMLCSTDDPIVKSTWQHLGFHFTSEEQMEVWDIPHSDLVYLQNTVQMHKDLPNVAPQLWKPVIIKHGDLKMRMYARIGEGRPVLPLCQPPVKRQARGPLPTTSGGTAIQPTYSTATSLTPGPAATASEASGDVFTDWNALPASSGKSPVTTQWGSTMAAGGETESSMQVLATTHEQEVDGLSAPHAQAVPVTAAP